MSQEDISRTIPQEKIGEGGLLFIERKLVRENAMKGETPARW